MKPDYIVIAAILVFTIAIWLAASPFQECLRTVSSVFPDMEVWQVCHARKAEGTLP